MVELERRRHRRAARRARRAVAFQPGDAAARGLSDHGERGIPVQLRLPGAGAAAAVRQGEVRDLDRGDALLPERGLHARRRPGRTGRCCAASPPTGTGWRASTRRCPRARRICPGSSCRARPWASCASCSTTTRWQIAVSVSETKVRFATPEVTLTSKVIDGTFPDYARVIPTGNAKRLEVDAAEFAQAVDRVATVSSERSRAVKMALEEDRLVLSVNAPDFGRGGRGAVGRLWRRAAGDRLQRQVPAGDRRAGGPGERGVPVQLGRRPDADARGQRRDGGLCRDADAGLTAGCARRHPAEALALPVASGGRRWRSMRGRWRCSGRTGRARPI